MKLPKFIAAHYVVNDHTVPPTSKMLRDAYQAARAPEKWIKPVPTDLVDEDFDPSMCWENVEIAVEKFGGKAINGWSFHDDPIFDQTNRLARWEAIAHCVWQDTNGKIWDLTPNFMGSPFAPSSVVVPYCACNIGFVDNELYAKTYRPPFEFVPYRNKYIPVPK